jgi:hypothetical protein
VVVRRCGAVRGEKKRRDLGLFRLAPEKGRKTQCKFSMLFKFKFLLFLAKNPNSIRLRIGDNVGFKNEI